MMKILSPLLLSLLLCAYSPFVLESYAVTGDGISSSSSSSSSLRGAGGGVLDVVAERREEELSDDYESDTEEGRASSLSTTTSSSRTAKRDVKNARTLVRSGGWGVMATLRTDKKQGIRPFTNVVNYVDDEWGVPHFLLTTMDGTARDLSSDNVASFTISAKTVRGNLACMVLDAQDPPCAKITFSGKVAPLPVSPKSTPAEDEAAKKIAERFKKKYPQTRWWPSGHDFKLYKFVRIDEIFFLDHFGGARPMSVTDYQRYKEHGEEISATTTTTATTS